MSKLCDSKLLTRRFIQEIRKIGTFSIYGFVVTEYKSNFDAFK